MLLFFRNMRNKAFKNKTVFVYLGYAVGEIILVVIGILIAVSIDNRNELAKRHQEELENYSNIIADLKKDSAQISQHLYVRKLHQIALYHIYYETQDKRAYTDSIRYELLGSTASFTPRTEKNHQATIAQLENKKVRGLLNDYFNKQDNLIEAVTEYNEIVLEHARPFVFEKMVIDADKVFHDNIFGFFPAEGGIANYKKLPPHYSDPQFIQMLAKLRLASGRILVEMEDIQLANYNLIQQLGKVELE